MGELDKVKGDNRMLKKVLLVFCIIGAFLIAGVFGASVTAIRLSQDITVDHTDGFAYVKGTGHSEVLKTAEAIIYADGTDIGSNLSNEKLHCLRGIVLDGGDLRFTVNGFARDPLSGNVVLQVEGGTLTLDKDGIVDARGDAKYPLEFVYGSLSEHDVGSDVHRHYIHWGASHDDNDDFEAHDD